MYLSMDSESHSLFAKDGDRAVRSSWAFNTSNVNCKQSAGSDAVLRASLIFRGIKKSKKEVRRRENCMQRECKLKKLHECWTLSRFGNNERHAGAIFSSQDPCWIPMDDLRKYRNQGTSGSSYSSSRGQASTGSSAGRTYGSGGGYGGGGSSYSSRNPGRSAFADDDDDEDVEGIKQQIRGVKQDTLSSTRNALRALNESEEVGSRTLNKLSQQTDQMINVERQLDMADLHTDRAADRTDELTRLNKSIFRPTFKNPFSSGKAKKRDEEMERAKQQYRDQADARAEGAAASYQSKQRMEKALYGDVSQASSRGKYASDRSKYTFEGDSEDDRIEDEIDSNLDQMSEGLARLKGIGLAMNTEVKSQNERLDRISGKTDRVGEKIAVGTKRLERFK